MNKYKIKPIDEYEFNLEANGWSFHICLGSHTGGNYIAIPDWGVCSEASNWNDDFWNEDQLSESKNETVSENAEVIAKAVKKYMSWKEE